MYQIRARLFNGRKLVGYVLLDSNGKVQNLSILEVRRLVKLGRVKSATISGDSITLIGGSIKELPRINLSDNANNKERTVANDKHKIVLNKIYLHNNRLECDFNMMVKDVDSIRSIINRLGEYFKDSETKRMRIQPHEGVTLKIKHMELMDLRHMCLVYKDIDVSTVKDKETFMNKCMNIGNDKVIINLVGRTLDKIIV